jgi:hypothetical protein
MLRVDSKLWKCDCKGFPPKKSPPVDPPVENAEKSRRPHGLRAYYTSVLSLIFQESGSKIQQTIGELWKRLPLSPLPHRRTGNRSRLSVTFAQLGMEVRAKGGDR